MKTARKNCRVCGALLFTVTYTGTTPPVLKVEDAVAVFFDGQDRCLATCPICGAITPAPQMTAIVNHMTAHQRVH